jgi:hypothetical protein
MAQIWQLYKDKYGTKNTTGFSFNHVDEKGARRTLEMYEESGAFPEIIGLDIYDNVYSYLKTLKGLLVEFGVPNIPLYIQETYYNDAQVMSDIALARKKLKLNIRYVMQWPMTRASSSKHVNIAEPVDYNAYSK